MRNPKPFAVLRPELPTARSRSLPSTPAVGLRSSLEGFVPQVPDWANDKRTTIVGKKLGRGIDHFRNEGAKLIRADEPDPYIEEAYRLWKLKQEQR